MRRCLAAVLVGGAQTGLGIAHHPPGFRRYPGEDLVVNGAVERDVGVSPQRSGRRFALAPVARMTGLELEETGEQGTDRNTDAARAASEAFDVACAG